MATTWTDATLFEAGDIVLPQILTNVTTSNYEPWVKTRVGYYLNYYFADYTDFDIEEIKTASITMLKDPALTLNLHKICQEQSLTMVEDDTFRILKEEYEAQYLREMKMLSPSLKFDEPDGINDRKTFTRAVKL